MECFDKILDFVRNEGLFKSQLISFKDFLNAFVDDSIRIFLYDMLKVDF